MWLLSEKDGIQLGKFLYTEVNRIIHYVSFANAPVRLANAPWSNLEVQTYIQGTAAYKNPSISTKL